MVRFRDSDNFEYDIEAPDASGKFLTEIEYSVDDYETEFEIHYSRRLGLDLSDRIVKLQRTVNDSSNGVWQNTNLTLKKSLIRLHRVQKP